MIASLVRRFGDIDVAEEAAGEALVVALDRWPVDGTPPNPGGWLMTTAGRRALDRLRREQRRGDKHRAAQMIHDDTPHEPTGPVDDDRLRLIFTCCHPALSPEARVALTLRLLGGLTVAEVAQAFLVPETTMAQRITRAKAKIRDAKIPYRVPAESDLTDRLSDVLAVLFLVFNEGYLASGGGEPIRHELTGEAIRLTRALHAQLPGSMEVTGLLALMLLIEARRATRVSRGELVPLDQQDRGGWDRSLIAEGHALCAPASPPTGRVATSSSPRSTRCTPTHPRGRHRLGPDRDPLRPARRNRPLADRRSQPRHRSGRARRPCGRPRPRRRAPDDDVPRLARHPRRPAAPPRPQQRSARRVRRRDRGHGERRRAWLPRTASRRARLLTDGLLSGRDRLGRRCSRAVRAVPGRARFLNGALRRRPRLPGVAAVAMMRP